MTTPAPAPSRKEEPRAAEEPTTITSNKWNEATLDIYKLVPGNFTIGVTVESQMQHGTAKHTFTALPRERVNL